MGRADLWLDIELSYCLRFTINPDGGLCRPTRYNSNEEEL